MAKSEISWKRVNDEGVKLQVYAYHSGHQWAFFVRERRFDNWEPLEQPPLVDWLALLDGLERRVARRRYRPELVQKLKKTIRDNFPDEPLS